MSQNYRYLVAVKASAMAKQSNSVENAIRKALISDYRLVCSDTIRGNAMGVDLDGELLPLGDGDLAAGVELQYVSPDYPCEREHTDQLPPSLEEQTLSHIRWVDHEQARLKERLRDAKADLARNTRRRKQLSKVLTDLHRVKQRAVKLDVK